MMAEMGKSLERWVADVYRQMGAEVKCDVMLRGHQIDVYVVMAGPDRSLHRIAVEAKDWQSRVGVDVVSRWAVVVDDLRRTGLIDEGIIIASVGFTKPARQASAVHVRRGLPVRLLELDDLDAMVARVEATRPAEQQYAYDIFVSYSHKDSAWVHNVLLPRLEEAGLRVYIDFRDFVVGEPSLVNMEQGIDNSRYTLLVLTPDWLESEWTSFASLLVGTSDPAGRRGRLIPLLLKPCNLPPRIAILTYLDFTQEKDRTEEWERLLEALGSRLPAPTETKAMSIQRRSTEALLVFLKSPAWQGLGVLIALLALTVSLWTVYSDFGSISLPSLPMPATWIVLLVLAFLTVLGIYSSRMVLPRWKQARINRERERDWRQWEGEIERLLFDEGVAVPEELVETPQEHRIFAIEKYFRDHGRQLAISLRARGNKLELDNKHLTSRFMLSWGKASSYLASLDKASFLAACSDILDCLRDLGIHRCEVQFSTLGRLHGFVVEVPSPSLNIPRHFPIVFVQKNEFSAEDVEDVVVLRKQMGLEGAYFIVVVVFNRAADVEEGIKAESSVYDIDFCVLDRERLWNMMISRTGEKDLAKALIEKASLLRISPYLTYGPAPDPVFFGREREISRALARVKKASIAIVGGRRIGKTSTLNRIERALAKRFDVHSIYLDCYKIRDYKAFFDKLDTNLEALQLPRARREPLRFDSVVSSMQGEVGSKRLVFLMDEVDALLAYDIGNNEDLFGTFRSVSQEGRCSFVLCGARTLYFSLHNPDSALFNFCDAVPLGYLDAENSSKLITRPMARMGVRIENEQILVDKIIATTSGHPNLVQFVCRKLVERIDKERRRTITLDDFLVVSESAEFREFFTEVVWGDTTALERLVMLSLVEERELTEGGIMDALRNQGVPIDLKQLQQAIRGLRLYSIVVDVGNRYTFVAKAFPDIVKYSQDIDRLRSQYKKDWKEARE